jgi:hypothetical protein
LKLFEKVMYPVLVLIVFYAIYLARLDKFYFESNLAQEGGFFQCLIFGTILFASCMCFYRASILRPFRGGTFSGCLVAMGILFLAFALDEISWGQVFFDFASPKFFIEHNMKGQLNIHHLVIAGFHINNIIFTLAIKILATLYFIILPFFYKRLDRLKAVVNRFAIPLPRYTHGVAYGVIAILMSFIPSDLRYIVFELCFYWILVLMMYNPLNEEIFSRVSLVR